MDKIYKKEVDGLRKQGRQVVEVSQLAIDSRLFPKNWFSMFNFSKLMFIFRLFKLVLDYALYVEGINDFCIAINPKHQYLYKFLNFEELAGLRYYGSVNKAPAIAKRINLDTAEERSKSRRALTKVFFDKKTNPENLKNKFKFSDADFKYFFVEKSDIFKKSATKYTEYIRTCYKGPKI